MHIIWVRHGTQIDRLDSESSANSSLLTIRTSLISQTSRCYEFRVFESWEVLTMSVTMCDRQGQNLLPWNWHATHGKHNKTYSIYYYCAYWCDYLKVESIFWTSCHKIHMMVMSTKKCLVNLNNTHPGTGSGSVGYICIYIYRIIGVFTSAQDDILGVSGQDTIVWLTQWGPVLKHLLYRPEHR